MINPYFRRESDRLKPKTRPQRVKQRLLLLSAGIDTIPVPLSHTLVDAPCKRFHRFHVAEHFFVDRRDLDSHSNQARVALFIMDTSLRAE